MGCERLAIVFHIGHIFEATRGDSLIITILQQNYKIICHEWWHETWETGHRLPYWAHIWSDSWRRFDNPHSAKKIQNYLSWMMTWHMRDGPSSSILGKYLKWLVGDSLIITILWTKIRKLFVTNDDTTCERPAIIFDIRHIFEATGGDSLIITILRTEIKKLFATNTINAFFNCMNFPTPRQFMFGSHERLPAFSVRTFPCTVEVYNVNVESVNCTVSAICSVSLFTLKLNYVKMLKALYKSGKTPLISRIL
jgi:hypothetical protein